MSDLFSASDKTIEWLEGLAGIFGIHKERIRKCRRYAGTSRLGFVAESVYASHF